MKLQKAARWIETHFTEDSKPDISTVKKWVQAKLLHGYTIGSQTYIDVDAFNVAAAKKQEFAPETKNKFEFIDS